MGIVSVLKPHNRGMLKKIYLLSAGGMLGAAARYSLNGFAPTGAADQGLLPGSMAFSLLGCLLAGFLLAGAESAPFLSAELRSLVLVVFLGAFAVFSVMSHETLNLMRGGEIFLAVMDAAVNLAVSLTQVWAGRVMAGWLWK